jgi:hypothetical protein
MASKNLPRVTLDDLVLADETVRRIDHELRLAIHAYGRLVEQMLEESSLEDLHRFLGESRLPPQVALAIALEVMLRQQRSDLN